MKSLIFIIAIFSILFTNCKKEAPSNSNEIYMSNSMFTPSSITVEAGTTVKWTNKETVLHTVTSDSLIFNSGNLDKNKTFSFTFSSKGTYPYRCILHNNMVGTIIVQ